MLHVDLFMEEETGTLSELGCRLCRKVLTGATTGKPFVHFRMTMKIVLKAGGYVLTLWNDFYVVVSGEGLELLVDFVE